MATDPTKLAESLEAAISAATDPKYRDALEMLSERLERNAADAEAVATSFGALKRAQHELADSTKSLERSTERLIRSLTGVEQQADGVVAGIFRMTKDLKDDGIPATKAFGQALGTMGKTISKTMTPMNMGISVFKKFAEASVVLTMEIDNASSAFAKATGTGNQYKNLISSVEQDNRRLGVSASESAAATSTLIGGFSEFLMIDGDLQKALVTEITQFEKFGVAAGTTTKFLQNVTRTTGRSIPAAQRLQKSIMGTANAFGDDLNKVMEESAEIMPKLAIHGQNLEGVFNNLYSASKRTGMGMSEIVSFAEQFDTFDSAAQAAGNLNAVLGQMGGAPLVDTMQILEETDPAKRMQLFSDAIQQSVGDFEQLGYYQQKAIANTMGMSVEETRRILLQEEETNKLNTAMQKAGLSQEEMLELQEQGRDLMTEMKILAMQFAVALEPVIGLIKGIIGGMSDILGMFPKGVMGGLGKLAVVAAGAWISGKTIKLMLSKLISVPQMALLTEISASASATAVLVGKIATQFTAMMVRQGVLPGRAAAGVRGTHASQIIDPFAAAGATTLPPGAPAAAGASAAAIAGGVTAGLAGFAMAKMAWDTVQAEKNAKKKKKRMGMGIGGLAGGGLLGAGLLTAGVLSGPLGWGIMAALAGGGALAGAKMGGLATGGIVTKPTMALTGEKGPEAVVPLNAQGREGIGMTDNNKLLEANNNKLDELIAAVKSQPPVLIKSDLERAGFMNKFAKVTG